MRPGKKHHRNDGTHSKCSGPRCGRRSDHAGTHWPGTAFRGTGVQEWSASLIRGRRHRSRPADVAAPWQARPRFDGVGCPGRRPSMPDRWLPFLRASLTVCASTHAHTQVVQGFLPHRRGSVRSGVALGGRKEGGRCSVWTRSSNGQWRSSHCPLNGPRGLPQHIDAHMGPGPGSATTCCGITFSSVLPRSCPPARFSRPRRPTPAWFRSSASAGSHRWRSERSPA